VQIVGDARVKLLRVDAIGDNGHIRLNWQLRQIRGGLVRRRDDGVSPIADQPVILLHNGVQPGFSRSHEAPIVVDILF